MLRNQINQPKIILVAGAILVIVALFAGSTVFYVMQRHAEQLLSNSLRSSLQNRQELANSEIQRASEKIATIATRPLLIDQLERTNKQADDATALNALDRGMLSFISTGITAITLTNKDGRQVARAGNFVAHPDLTTTINSQYGPVQLLSADKLYLHAEFTIHEAGQVIGRVVAETPLPIVSQMLKSAKNLGVTGELALCAPAGLNMNCFPTTLKARAFSVPKRTPQGVALPMTHALEGETGFITALDYRHQKVVAAYTPVENLGLGMVLKMDSAELYAPVWDQLSLLISLLVIVIMIALILLRLLLTPLVTRLIFSEQEAQLTSANLRDN